MCAHLNTRLQAQTLRHETQCTQCAGATDDEIEKEERKKVNRVEERRRNIRVRQQTSSTTCSFSPFLSSFLSLINSVARDVYAAAVIVAVFFGCGGDCYRTLYRLPYFSQFEALVVRFYPHSDVVVHFDLCVGLLFFVYSILFTFAFCHLLMPVSLLFLYLSQTISLLTNINN